MNEAPEDGGGARREENRLRFLICGETADGTSTLLGRLLSESALVCEKELAPRFGASGGKIDFARLFDGLEEGREERGATSAAYRFFATPRRAFLVAESPGEEHSARHMADAASNSDLAVFVVDATKGMLRHTRRHGYVSSLFGIRCFVLAVNEMDLVGFDQARFEEVAAAFAEFASALGVDRVEAIPLAARFGDNVVTASARMPWYKGPTLLEYLERVEVAREGGERPFRFAVQWVNRPHPDFRGCGGTVASGSIAAGERVLAAGTGRVAEVKEILATEGPLARAGAGDAVTLVLAEEIDLAPGDLLADPKNPPEFADQFAAHLLWTSEEPLVPGRSYLLTIGTRRLAATVTALKHRIDVDSLAHLADKSLKASEIGFCNLSTAAPVAFDPYERNRETGAFILIDRFTGETAGAGMIAFALRRASNIHWQALTIGRNERAALKGQVPAVLWFTGLSGAGKSTIADLVEKKLHARGRHTMLLDGDNLRHGLNRDLGFTEVDRVENIRRVGEVARLMNEAGLIVLCSFISPFRAERRMVRDAIEPTAFFEIYVDTPLAECMRRDPKGLYLKAQRGEIRNFTGFDSPYEAPLEPEIHLLGGEENPQALADRILDALARRGIL